LTRKINSCTEPADLDQSNRADGFGRFAAQSCMDQRLISSPLCATTWPLLDGLKQVMRYFGHMLRSLMPRA
jgi:hypothetical protein